MQGRCVRVEPERGEQLPLKIDDTLSPDRLSMPCKQSEDLLEVVAVEAVNLWIFEARGQQALQCRRGNFSSLRGRLLGGVQHDEVQRCGGAADIQQGPRSFSRTGKASTEPEVDELPPVVLRHLGPKLGE